MNNWSKGSNVQSFMTRFSADWCNRWSRSCSYVLLLPLCLFCLWSEYAKSVCNALQSYDFKKKKDAACSVFSKSL